MGCCPPMRKNPLLLQSFASETPEKTVKIAAPAVRLTFALRTWSCPRSFMPFNNLRCGRVALPSQRNVDPNERLNVGKSFVERLWREREAG